MEHSNLAKLISNYGSRLWSMVSVFVFIPLYINFLGSENYGLIGFYALLLGIISFADSGMSSAIIKEFSQDSSSNYKFSVFKNLEKTYIIICILICLVIFLCAGYIADHWITSNNINREDLLFLIRLIGIGITTQLISSLYYGALFALNSQVKSNLLQFAWSFGRSAVVFVLFIVFSKSIEIYFFWQIICNVLYIIILRINIIAQLNKYNTGIPLELEFKKLPDHIINYIGGMIFIAVISAINIQADKLVTSSMFNLEIFGFYNIASSLSQMPVIFAAPLIAFAFPLFSKFSTSDSPNSIQKNLLVFNKIFYLINLIVIVLTFGIFFYAREILIFWTKNAIPTYIFNEIVFDVKLLILGSFFLALQFPLYYFLLSKGKTKFTIYQGIIQLIVGIPLLYFCSKNYGLYGIPIPWLTINFLAFLYLFFVVSKKFLNFATVRFYLQTFLSPIIISLFISVIIYYIYSQFQINFIPFFISSSFLCLGFSMLFYNKFENASLMSFKHFYNFPHE